MTAGNATIAAEAASTRAAALRELHSLFPTRDSGALKASPSRIAARLGFELAWLRGLRGLPSGTAQLLAARIACLAAEWGPATLRAAEPGMEAWNDAKPLIGTSAAPADSRQLARLWKVAQPLEMLLAAGGDDRLALSSDTTLNRYGCAPWPRPHVISFGSCTASSLPPSAFAAAERRRRSIVEHALAVGAEAAVEAATAEVEASILAYFQAGDLATAILTASGTDAALTVTGLLTAEHPELANTSVLVGPSETGSGVPLAVQGRYFASLSPDGSAVEKGGCLSGLAKPLNIAAIDLRHSDGQPRDTAEIARDCEAAIQAATRRGRAVLHVLDGSKTGLTAPDRPTLLRLAKRFGEKLDIVIDACQARIEPALVRWYLSHGFPVLVTGSKFFSAPGFCGAVLFPRARLARIRESAPLPAGLAAYMRLQGGSGSRLCLGLLLRWEAALDGMTRFAAAPPDEVGRRLDELGEAATRALASDRRVQLIAASRPPGMGWSDRRSVFTFKVAGDGGWLDPGRLRRLYLAMQDPADAAPGPVCQIGQPVEIGHPELGGLRIAFSAQQVLEPRETAALLPVVMEKLGGLLGAAQRPLVSS